MYVCMYVCKHLISVYVCICMYVCGSVYSIKIDDFMQYVMYSFTCECMYVLMYP